MNTVEVMAEYARLGQVHDALNLLSTLGVVSRDDVIRLTRKFMDDRPEFKKAVAQAMGGTVISPTSTRGVSK